VCIALDALESLLGFGDAQGDPSTDHCFVLRTLGHAPGLEGALVDRVEGLAVVRPLLARAQD
jgi:hypothetical protein